MSYGLCHLSHVTCHMSHVKCLYIYIYFTNWWSESLEGLLPTGPTSFSLFGIWYEVTQYYINIPSCPKALIKNKVCDNFLQWSLCQREGWLYQLFSVTVLGEKISLKGTVLQYNFFPKRGHNGCIDF